ncbi:hypothetical protein [Salegentibacter chungangensis]|uniref:Uncharacterized protein n=1 Tax=Salegentibacter chungangensis TaxID=1335724 RepID=A0ABW3NM66_9FLAO
MKSKALTLVLVFAFIFSAYSQDRLKRPKKRVGVASVDSIVTKSFDMYDDVYTYKQKVDAGHELDSTETDVLEYILEESEDLSEYALDAASELDGISVLKQGKAVLQLNRAKKALQYCAVTCKELMVGEDVEEESSGNN